MFSGKNTPFLLAFPGGHWRIGRERCCQSTPALKPDPEYPAEIGALLRDYESGAAGSRSQVVARRFASAQRLSRIVRNDRIGIIFRHAVFLQKPDLILINIL